MLHKLINKHITREPSGCSLVEIIIKILLNIMAFVVYQEFKLVQTILFTSLKFLNVQRMTIFSLDPLIFNYFHNLHFSEKVIQPLTC